jgi:hypothetical protein
MVTLTSQECIAHVSTRITQAICSMSLQDARSPPQLGEFEIVDLNGITVGRTTSSDAWLVHCIKTGVTSSHVELTTYACSVLAAYITNSLDHSTTFPRLYLSKFTDSMIRTKYSETEKTVQRIQCLVQDVFLTHRYVIAGYFRLYLTENYRVDMERRTVTVTNSVEPHESLHQAAVRSVDMVIHRIFQDLLNPKLDEDLEYLAGLDQGSYKSFIWGHVFLWFLSVLSCALFVLSLGRNLYQTGSMVHTGGQRCRNYIRRVRKPNAA